MEHTECSCSLIGCILPALPLGFALTQLLLLRRTRTRTRTRTTTTTTGKTCQPNDSPETVIKAIINSCTQAWHRVRKLEVRLRGVYAKPNRGLREETHISTIAALGKNDLATAISNTTRKRQHQSNLSCTKQHTHTHTRTPSMLT